jgi:hypothetical protein
MGMVRVMRRLTGWSHLLLSVAQVALLNAALK